MARGADWFQHLATMIKHTYSSLIQRPTRTLVSVLAISVGVVLILVSVGLTYGQLNSSAERTRNVGGDFMIQPPDSSLFLALSSGTMPVGIRKPIEEIDGIEVATPVLVKFLAEEFHLVFGIELESFSRVNKSLRIVRGRFFESNEELIVDTIYASTRNIGVGDHLEILGNEFVVSGIFEQGTAARVLIPLAKLQEMNGTIGKASMFFAVVDEESEVDEVYARLKERMKFYKITKTTELNEIMTSSTPVFKEFLSAIVFLSVVISFLIILLAMYSTITERTREIGILKSLGASKSYIVQMILKESVLICIAGIIVGYILTFVAIRLIIFAFPAMPVDIPGYWYIASIFMAIAGGILGAAYPSAKAAQLDPVRALGYE